MLGLSLSLNTPDFTSGFSLSDYAGLDVWYDFSTVAGGQGSAIASLSNKGAGGSSHDITAQSGEEPTVDTTGMNLKSALFDDTDDHYDLGSAYTSNDDLTAAFVFKITSGFNQDAALSGTTGGLNRMYVFNANALLFRFNGGAGGNGGIVLNHNDTNNGTINYSITSGVEVLVVRKDSSDNLSVYNKNGDFISYYPADTLTDQPFKLGIIGLQEPTTSPFGGNIGEIGFWNSDLGEDKAKEIAQGLYNKWNI